MRAREVYTPLRTRAAISRVHQQGRRKSEVLLQVRVLPMPVPPPTDSPIRLGILVTRKYGNAVARNRFKRLVRAALRELGSVLRPGWDILILPRQAEEATMPQVRDALRGLLDALGLLRPPEQDGTA
jgi:ribonuclease P protein component